MPIESAGNQGLRDGLLESFGHELNQAGYAKTTVREHIRAAQHFIYWTDRKGTAVADLNESYIESFGCHLDRCRCPGYHHTDVVNLQSGARVFLAYLRDAGVTASLAPQTMPEAALLTAFHHWTQQQRGTCDATLYHYGLAIRELLTCLGDDPGRFDAQSLRKFVLERSQKLGWSAAKNCATATRMFLRFLIAVGKCPAGLDASIPALAHWRLSSLPRYLQSDEVEHVIASCDRASPVGRRDHAILLLLARCALRAGDIVQLRLGDIDWEQAWIRVSGKSRCQTLLPLTQEVGDALVAYLQNGRRAWGTDRLFTRARPPCRGFATHSAVSLIVRGAMRRAGITSANRGAAHILRHSAATSMLRQGASLQEIGTVLRHRAIQTTEIYAKVDVTALSLIAQPWPEVESC